MLRKLHVVAVMLCMVSYASAGTLSIGTASARGDMRVDSYLVKGNATLFDGSVVETGQATADLRLEKGTEITMSTGSRGTLYRDRLVLQQGRSELAANSSFQLEANGLRVTPIEPNSRGVVSLKAGNTVEVAALNGSFGVTNESGALLASVRPGQPISFAIQAGAAGTTFTATGKVSVNAQGNYFITVAKTGVKYQITGKNLANLVGKNVKITGTTVSGAAPAAGATAVVAVATTQVLAVGALGTTALVVTGTVVAAGVGTAVGVYEANQSSTPASR
jgi:hypothetical protein